MYSLLLAHAFGAIFGILGLCRLVRRGLGKFWGLKLDFQCFWIRAGSIMNYLILLYRSFRDLVLQFLPSRKRDNGFAFLIHLRDLARFLL